MQSQYKFYRIYITLSFSLVLFLILNDKSCRCTIEKPLRLTKTNWNFCCTSPQLLFISHLLTRQDKKGGKNFLVCPPREFSLYQTKQRSPVHIYLHLQPIAWFDHKTVSRFPSRHLARMRLYVKSLDQIRYFCIAISSLCEERLMWIDRDARTHTLPFRAAL